MIERVARRLGRESRVELLAAGVCVFVACLGFCSCGRLEPQEEARAGLRIVSNTAAFELAVFRRQEGCYPHAKAGLKYVLSEDGFAPFKNPDGSFTAAFPNFGPHVVKSADCFYLNPAPGTLGDPAAKVVLVVLVEKEFGLTAVIDSSCNRYLLRPGAGRDLRGLLGEPVSELERRGDIAESHLLGDISSDTPPVPWRATCDRAEHLPVW